jgi:hypothetical protein
MTAGNATRRVGGPARAPSDAASPPVDRRVRELIGDNSPPFRCRRHGGRRGVLATDPHLFVRHHKSP